METPHARIAVISLSADILPKVSIIETRDAQGNVKVNTMGIIYSRNSPATERGTPCVKYSIDFINWAPVIPKDNIPIAMTKVVK
jgi:hypothetical protein